MSNHSPNATHSQPQNLPPSPNRTELAALAQKLQETAQALFMLCGEAPPAGNETERGMPNGSGTPLSKNGDFGAAGETRSYYFSPSTLQHERELLEKYRAKDFHDLLDQAHIHLVGLVKLMKSVHSDVRVRGYVISSLGCLLEQTSALLLRMRNLYAKVGLVENSVEREVSLNPRSTT